MHTGIAHDVAFGLLGNDRKDRAPQAGRAVSGHLETIAPGARVGEIAAIAIAALRLEVIRRREHDELLRPGEAVERNIALLANDAAAAIGANEITAGMGFYAAWPAHLDRG